MQLSIYQKAIISARLLHVRRTQNAHETIACASSTLLLIYDILYYTIHLSFISVHSVRETVCLLCAHLRAHVLCPWLLDNLLTCLAGAGGNARASCVLIATTTVAAVRAVRRKSPRPAFINHIQNTLKFARDRVSRCCSRIRNQQNIRTVAGARRCCRSSTSNSTFI